MALENSQIVAYGTLSGSAYLGKDRCYSAAPIRFATPPSGSHDKTVQRNRADQAYL